MEADRESWSEWNSRLKAGQLADFFALLSDKQKRSTREGKPYYQLKFKDRLRTVSAPIWDGSPFCCPPSEDWQVGQIFKIRGTYQEHKQFGPQIEIQNIRLATEDDRADGYDPSAFVSRTRFNVDELFAELIHITENIANPSLRDLTLYLLKKNEEIIREQPAACRKSIMPTEGDSSNIPCRSFGPASILPRNTVTIIRNSIRLSIVT